MPTRPTRLSDVIEEYLQARLSDGYSRHTARVDRLYLEKLLRHVGNVQIKSIDDRMVDDLFRSLMHSLSPGSLNNMRAVLRNFFKYARRRKYVGPEHDPVGHRRPVKFIPREKHRLPAHHFPRLLDAAPHPRDRAILAVGLYLLLRQQSIALLTVGDVSLDTGEVHVTIPKTKRRDIMPISAELDHELRRWFTAYSGLIGRPLLPTDLLTPAKEAVTPVRQTDGTYLVPRVARLRPSTPMVHMETVAQRALAAIGYPLRDADGVALNEGMHTLRRSAARARFDMLVDSGYDGALRQVQSLLHHANSATTEVYLGLGLDEVKRNDSVRGKLMFAAPVADGTVVSLDDRRNNGTGTDGDGYV